MEGEVIVKFKAPGGSPAFASEAAGAGLSLKKSWGVMNVRHFSAKAGNAQGVEQMVKSLNADPNVEFAEPNYILKKQSTGIEGGKLSFNEVQAMRAQDQAQQKVMGKVSTSSGSGYYQSGANIQVTQAWSILANTPYIPVVAVIDTGVDYNHEVFIEADAIWRNTGEIAGNSIDDDGNGYIDDVRGWNFVSDTNNPMDDEDHGTRGGYRARRLGIFSPTHCRRQKLKSCRLNFGLQRQRLDFGCDRSDLLCRQQRCFDHQRLVGRWRLQ